MEDESVRRYFTVDLPPFKRTCDLVSSGLEICFLTFDGDGSLFWNLRDLMQCNTLANVNRAKKAWRATFWKAFPTAIALHLQLWPEVTEVPLPLWDFKPSPYVPHTLALTYLLAHGRHYFVRGGTNVDARHVCWTPARGRFISLIRHCVDTSGFPTLWIKKISYYRAQRGIWFSYVTHRTAPPPHHHRTTTKRRR